VCTDCFTDTDTLLDVISVFHIISKHLLNFLDKNRAMQVINKPYRKRSMHILKVVFL